MKWKMFSRGFVAGAFVLLLAAPAYPQGKKGGGGKTKYQFNFIFDGNFTLLQKTDDQIPWAMESGAGGGTGNIGGSGNPPENGPIPLIVSHIASGAGLFSLLSCSSSPHVLTAD